MGKVLNEMRRPDGPLTVKDLERLEKIYERVRTYIERINLTISKLEEIKESLNWMNYMSEEDFSKLTEEQRVQLYQQYQLIQYFRDEIEI